MQDPTNDFCFIPSWNREFVCLIGLEEVVLFRFERLDKTVFTAPNKRRTKGRLKKIPIPAVVPATLPKDPYTCVKCHTDVSCSWKLDFSSYTRVLLIPKCVVQQPGRNQTSGEEGSKSKSEDSEAKNLNGVLWQPFILLFFFFFFFFCFFFIGQTEKVKEQVLVSPEMKIYITKFRSTPNGKPFDPK
ncbi:hypothetical protein AMELA_G00068030 [Ameiurus melas]|uniref:Uncharacterized protein n=1 Tax=Ameiurus melas TaxID=219545 RepID=A0A7J6B589_AMEME|nr:hypothetical protein AMELA_G00068030 [Ameiurus melas]